MKFVLMVEESGYEIRYWDEVQGEIRDTLASGWTIKELHENLEAIGFNITIKNLQKALDIVKSGEPFIVLNSKSESLLHTFHDDWFEVAE